MVTPGAQVLLWEFWQPCREKSSTTRPKDISNTPRKISPLVRIHVKKQFHSYRLVPYQEDGLRMEGLTQAHGASVTLPESTLQPWHSWRLLSLNFPLHLDFLGSEPT